ncbi:hypothetical protein GDO81_021694 [Engystomops pustulosus]|uniref:Uncharacterized protein n=1 Tax=Engystomops pustulosus TaxID=76066 RepID=A0AAV6YNY4_ENGPU|nr:hypothetical protein GDO81_021694 [Engystomops pustulosus]
MEIKYTLGPNCKESGCIFTKVIWLSILIRDYVCVQIVKLKEVQQGGGWSQIQWKSLSKHFHFWKSLLVKQFRNVPEMSHIGTPSEGKPLQHLQWKDYTGVIHIKGLSV